jgi:small-conductance mechanosensitive channel
VERRMSDRIVNAVGLEPAIVILILAVLSWIFYRFFLRDLSKDRHNLYRALFYNLLTYFIGGLVIFCSHLALEASVGELPIIARVLPYSGFVNIVLAAVIFIKILRIGAYNVLFFNSKKAGVPRLLVNIFSLILSLIVFGLILTEIFEVNISSVMATSAVLSVILGFALQDTLGNLFAAISLQIDKPFSLGDWIELRNGNDRVSGLVSEVSWRATVLTAITDEAITIPNRQLAQWQILNFSDRGRPFIRSQVFRISFDADLNQVRALLLESVRGDAQVLTDPRPLVLISETTESWVAIKLVYYINNYGDQFLIADRVLERALSYLKKNKIALASGRLLVEKRSAESANV